MLFNSVEFLVFFIIVYLLYRIFVHRWQNRLLVVASVLFYATWNWKFLPLMFFSITVDYLCAQQIEHSENAGRRKFFLILSISCNLAILAFFKYCNFFIDNINGVLHSFFPNSHPILPLHIILPLGISFYTFEAISYIVDVYKRIIKPANKYWDYILFVIYFPHLIAGPIMRAKDFLPQVSSPRQILPEMFYEGCYLIFWGIFEKVYIADNLAKMVDSVFVSSAPYEGFHVLTACYAFAFQIFCDFDGYSNIARGLGKCMGFDITINFRNPYFSINPSQFWTRWHITLSSWLKDYLYIPLGGNKKSLWMIFRNLMITMLLGGLWHGASWHFVFWGAYHGALLVIYRFIPYKSPDEPRSCLKDPYFFFNLFIFFHLVVLGWLFFRVTDMKQASSMLHAILYNFHLTPEAILFLGKFLAITFPLLFIQFVQFKSNCLEIIFKQHWMLKTIIYACMAYLIIGFGIMDATQFLYFQF